MPSSLLLQNHWRLFWQTVKGINIIKFHFRNQLYFHVAALFGFGEKNLPPLLFLIKKILFHAFNILTLLASRKEKWTSSGRTLCYNYWANCHYYFADSFKHFCSARKVEKESETKTSNGQVPAGNYSWVWPAEQEKAGWCCWRILPVCWKG